ncbi:MAG: LytR cell envelope-related transcriptional attenuator [Actinomycetota bacterium]
MKKGNQIILGSVLALVIISAITSAALSSYRANRIEAILNPKPTASAEEGVVTLDKMVVTILNGTNREGLSTRLASRLETFGVFVTKIDNYKKRNIETSELLYRPDAIEAATKLAQVAGIQKLTPYPAFEANEFATIITGYDLPEPFPQQIDSTSSQP